MKLFGWKGAAGSPRPALSRTHGWGAAGWMAGAAAAGEWPSAYEPQVRAAVLANPVAQRAVRLVTEGAGGAAIRAAGAAAADNARACELATRVSGGQGLVETLALHLLLHGNAYAQIMCDADGEPAELFALRPERVGVEVDARGWPVAYCYRVGDRTSRLCAEDGAGRPAIVHLKTANPLDDHYGLGCLGAASGPVAIHNAAQLQTVLQFLESQISVDICVAACAVRPFTPFGSCSHLSNDGMDIKRRNEINLCSEIMIGEATNQCWTV
ncbi:MAG: phage portal protein [Rhodospirillaceae bacterium]